MALTDLKLTPKEQKEEADPSYEAPLYPWGLCLDLDDDTLSKLGIGTMPVGTEIMLTAKAKVTSVSSYQNTEDPEGDSRMSLQIVGLDIAPMSSDANAASKLYGDK